MFRRSQSDEVSEHAFETFVRMARCVPEDTVVVGDSYFGGLQALEAIVKEGKHVLVSCNSRRPSALNSNYLAKLATENGQSASCYGLVADSNGNDVPFMANICRSEGRNLYTLSTVYSDTPCETSITALVPDKHSTDTDQYVHSSCTELRPEVRNRYSDLMDFVDQADSEISQSLTQHRKSHWTTNVTMWILTMLIVVNARRLYLSATVASDRLIQQDSGLAEWRVQVWRAMANAVTPNSVPFGDTHPQSALVPDEASRKCKSCWSSKHKTQRMTKWQCPSCGHICPTCQEDGTHLKHAKSDTDTRRYYSGSSFSASSSSSSQ